MAASQASSSLLRCPISALLQHKSGRNGWLFSSDAAVAVCVLSCLLLLPSCNADKNVDLFNGLNTYRLSLNDSLLLPNPGAECYAGKLAASIQDVPCSNTSAQYSVSEVIYPNSVQSLSACYISPENLDDARILPVCVSDGLVRSALFFYTTSAQVEYQGYLNSSTYVSAGVGSAGTNFIVILGTTQPSGNLAQNFSLHNGSPKRLPSMLFPLFAMLGVHLVSSCLLVSG